MNTAFSFLAHAARGPVNRVLTFAVADTKIPPPKGLLSQCFSSRSHPPKVPAQSKKVTCPANPPAQQKKKKTCPLSGPCPKMSRMSGEPWPARKKISPPVQPAGKKSPVRGCPGRKKKKTRLSGTLHLAGGESPVRGALAGKKKVACPGHYYPENR